MPVTLTVNQLAVETRVSTDSAVSPVEPWNTILQRQLSVGTEIVQTYAEDAPDDVLNEAVIRMVGYWLESPGFTRTPQNAFIHSGARALLAAWREALAEKIV